MGISWNQELCTSVFFMNVTIIITYVFSNTLNIIHITSFYESGGC